MPGFIVSVYRGKCRIFDVQLYESDGSTAIALAAADDVIVRIGRCGQTQIEVSSADGVTANGSSVTFTAATNDVTVTLGAYDTAELVAGIYCLEIFVRDDSEPTSQEPKMAEQGTLQVIGTLGEAPEDQSSSSDSSQSS